jgi:glycosyltransferase involved in cell wall biosynthesis
MKILFNCVNNVAGGSVQNAVNFIVCSVNDENNKFFYLLSPQVFRQVRHLFSDRENYSVLDAPLLLDAGARKVRQLEDNFMPDVVYTMAGPSLVRFYHKHVLGISDPYVTHAKSEIFFFNRTVYGGIKLMIKTYLKRWACRMFGDYYIFQTCSSLSAFVKRGYISSELSSVVPNAVSLDNLRVGSGTNICFRKDPECFHILVPSANYPHKNLSLLPDLILELRKMPNLVFKVIVTLDDLPSSLDGFQELVNIGCYPHRDAGSVYAIADVVLLPSILETFSTTYVEAMHLGLPLLAPDLPFVHEVCDDYPLYFPPFDYVCLAALIYGIFGSGHKSPTAVDRFLITQEERYSRIIEVLRRSLSGERFDVS